MRILIFVLATLFSLNVQAAVDVIGLGNWKITSIAPNTPEREFTQGAKAALTLGASEDEGPQISVYLYSRSKPLELQLGANRATWRKVIFKQIKTSKISLLSEAVTREHGYWRYQAEFLADDGSPTMLHCIVSALVIGGELNYLTYQHDRLIYQTHIADVRKLFHDLDFLAAK